MSKRLLALLFVGTISLAGVVLAQDPPAKDEPPAHPSKFLIISNRHATAAQTT